MEFRKYKDFIIEENTGNLFESVIGIKTERDFKPKNLIAALDKAKVKYKMNRLSMTLSVLNLDKKYYDDAKQIVDDLGLTVMLAKESVNEYGGSEWSVITAAKNFLYIDMGKFRDKLKDRKHLKAFDKAKKTFWETVGPVAEEHHEMYEGKINEANNFNMVSAKFKDALDDASEISTDSVKKLIKKFKEKRPDAAMEYAKQSFGWMFKEGKVNEASDRFLIKKLTDTFSKFKLSRKHEIMMDSSYGAGSKIPVLRPKGGFGDGAMIDYDGEPYPDGKIVLMSSKSGRPIPGESEFNDIDKAMVAATEYVDNIKESSAADLSSYSLINKTLKHTR